MGGSGRAYVTGATASTEATFPVAVGPNVTFNNGPGNAVADVVKVAQTQKPPFASSRTASHRLAPLPRSVAFVPHVDG